MFKFNSFVGRRQHVIDALCTFMLIIACLFNIALSSYCMCVMESCHEHKFTAVLVRVQTVMPQTVAVVCLVIRAKTMLHSANGEFREYEDKEREYDACFPDRVGGAFVAFIVSAYAVTILPINAYRLYLIHRDVRDHIVTTFFVLMYVQNLCTCSMEIHYVARCFRLYRRFCRINEDVSALKLTTVSANRYPSVLLQSANGCDDDGRHRRTTSGTRPTASDVELLRMRHQCVRDAVGDLNDLYGVQLLLSLCILCLMTVIDTYSEMFRNYSLARSQLFLYVWLTHYSFRLSAIVLTTHFTMKQAYRTKTLASDINNRILDISTKEENASVCITELQFVAYCFGLYQKYRSINDDMKVLKSRTIVTNRYPAVLNPEKYNGIRNSSGFNGDFCQQIKEDPLVNSIESLKMRHRFVSDSVNDLNDIHNLQLGLSLFILLVMTLFDIYVTVLMDLYMTERYWLLYVWLLQYAFRFCMIVLTAHVTTKQANKSKTILTDINNQHTDQNTKEEVSNDSGRFKMGDY
ncbi:hypothetical protein QTP88_002593 [Uroleucon formosanum]